MSGFIAILPEGFYQFSPRRRALSAGEKKTAPAGAVFVSRWIKLRLILPEQELARSYFAKFAALSECSALVAADSRF